MKRNKAYISAHSEKIFFSFCSFLALWNEKNVILLFFQFTMDHKFSKDSIEFQFANFHLVALPLPSSLSSCLFGLTLFRKIPEIIMTGWFFEDRPDSAFSVTYALFISVSQKIPQLLIFTFTYMPSTESKQLVLSEQIKRENGEKSLLQNGKKRKFN